MSPSSPEPERVRRLLDGDRVWAAYALADLEPPYAERSHWILGERSVGLLYSGVEPPLFFFLGDPAEIETAVDSLPAGPIQYGLLASHRARLADRLFVAREANMWRMALADPSRLAPLSTRVRRLGPEDVPALLDLFADHPDRPDSFHADQVENGVFFGIEVGERLVSAAGTHVVGRRARVAAIGNVFTHPDERRRGHASVTCAAVVRSLLDDGIETIVLNVGMDNDPALGLYAALGFRPFCGYYEGVGVLGVG